MEEEEENERAKKAIAGATSHHHQNGHRSYPFNYVSSSEDSSDGEGDDPLASVEGRSDYSGEGEVMPELSDDDDTNSSSLGNSGEGRGSDDEDDDDSSAYSNEVMSSSEEEDNEFARYKYGADINNKAVKRKQGRKGAATGVTLPTNAAVGAPPTATLNSGNVDLSTIRAPPKPVGKEERRRFHKMLRLVNPALRPHSAPFSPNEQMADIEDVRRLPRYAQSRRVHLAAVEEGFDCYRDLHTGCVVFCKPFLSQVPCCGQQCKHCPYGHNPLAFSPHEAMRVMAEELGRRQGGKEATASENGRSSLSSRRAEDEGLPSIVIGGDARPSPSSLPCPSAAASSGVAVGGPSNTFTVTDTRRPSVARAAAISPPVVISKATHSPPQPAAADAPSLPPSSSTSHKTPSTPATVLARWAREGFGGFQLVPAAATPNGTPTTCLSPPALLNVSNSTLLNAATAVPLHRNVDDEAYSEALLTLPGGGGAAAPTPVPLTDLPPSGGLTNANSAVTQLVSSSSAQPSPALAPHFTAVGGALGGEQQHISVTDLRALLTTPAQPINNNMALLAIGGSTPSAASSVADGGARRESFDGSDDDDDDDGTDFSDDGDDDSDEEDDDSDDDGEE